MVLPSTVIPFNILLVIFAFTLLVKAMEQDKPSSHHRPPTVVRDKSASHHRPSPSERLRGHQSQNGGGGYAVNPYSRLKEEARQGKTVIVEHAHIPAGGAAQAPSSSHRQYQNPAPSSSQQRATTVVSAPSESRPAFLSPEYLSEFSLGPRVAAMDARNRREMRRFNEQHADWVVKVKNDWLKEEHGSDHSMFKDDPPSIQFGSAYWPEPSKQNVDELPSSKQKFIREIEAGQRPSTTQFRRNYGYFSTNKIGKQSKPVQEALWNQRFAVDRRLGWDGPRPRPHPDNRFWENDSK